MGDLLGWLAQSLDFVDAHNGALTAIATALIAVFTVVLARVSTRQAQIALDAIRLARSEFTATHRPCLIVRDVVYVDGDVEYLIVNTGTGSAVVVESIVLMEIIGDERLVRNLRPYGNDVLGPLSFAVGEVKTLKLALTDEERRYFGAVNFFGAFPKAGRVGGEVEPRPEGHLHFAGAISYRDEGGACRLSVFRRIYEAGRGFRHPKNPDHQYAD